MLRDCWQAERGLSFLGLYLLMIFDVFTAVIKRAAGSIAAGSQNVFLKKIGSAFGVLNTGA